MANRQAKISQLEFERFYFVNFFGAEPSVKSMGRLKKPLVNFIRQENAPAFFEYALLITLIALVVVVSVVAFGTTVAGLFSTVNNSVPN